MTALRTSIELVGVTEQKKKLEEMDHPATQRLYAGMKTSIAVADKKVVADMSAVARTNLSGMMSGIGGGMTPMAPANPDLPGKVITHNTYVNGDYSVVGIVKSINRRYMAMAQVGRGPGRFPPQSKMRAWVASVMGISDPKENKLAARALGKAIAQLGVRGTPTLEKSRDAILPVVMAMMKAEMDKLAEDLSVGER